MVREAVQQGGGHLGIAENGRPFAESEIGRDDDRGAFVEAADQVEQELSAGLRERQVAESKRTRQVLDTDAGAAWKPSNRPA